MVSVCRLGDSTSHDKHVGAVTIHINATDVRFEHIQGGHMLSIVVRLHIDALLRARLNYAVLHRCCCSVR